MSESYFKCYQSIFKNESHVTKMTDIEKVLYMFLSSEMNRKEAKILNEKTENKAVIRTSHFYVASALSCSRPKATEGLNKLKDLGFYEYTGGYYVSGGRNAPSTITNLRKPEGEFYAQIDRTTFEFLLFDKVKSGEIKHRHIVVYALCKYIEQFEGGCVTVNEFGRMLGMTVKSVNWSRIQEPLEKLREMKLIEFKKGHGKIAEIKVNSLAISREKLFLARKKVEQEAEKLRVEEMGINSNTTANLEEMPAPENLPDLYNNVKDMYNKQTNKKAELTADQKRRIQNLGFTLQDLHVLTQQFFVEQGDRIKATDGKSIFSVYTTYLQTKHLQLMYKD